MVKSSALVTIGFVLATYLPTAGAEGQDLTLGHAEACAALLVQDGATTSTVVRDLGEQLTLEKGDFEFIARVRAVTDELVRAGHITPAQAESQFGDRVLGQYTSIFLKYVIAELRFRQFDDAQVIQFVHHFDDAFTVEEQVDFVLAVTRRMLMSINDVPSARDPRGMEQFTHAAAAFGVTPRTYSQFLQIWGRVRGAHPRTVVQFILANIRNAGELVRLETGRHHAEQLDHHPAPRWYDWIWTSMGGRPQPGAPTHHAAAVAVLNGLEFPDFILDVEDLHPESRDDSTWVDRATSDRPSDEFDAYLLRLSLRAPFIWTHVLGQKVPHLNLAELNALRAWPMYSKLSPELIDLVDASRERLVRLHDVIERLRDERRAEVRRSRQPTLGPPDPNFKVLNRFVEIFSATLLDQSSRRPTPEALGSSLAEAFITVRQQFPRMTGPDFLLIARKTVELVMVKSEPELAATLLRALMLASKDYAITTDEAQEVIDLVRLITLARPTTGGRIAFENQVGADYITDAARWGRTRVTQPALPVALSPALLAEFRNLLPSDEATGMTDRQLMDRLVPAEEPPAPTGLVFWNSGVIN